jgi:formate hydrogenlyase subunit 3/multisubunit Na+/H+ antiporter MnhD subunit
MPPALWLIVIPLLAIPFVYLFRRTIIGAIIATGVALFLAWLTIQLPLGLVITILGRPVELNQLSQITLILLFTSAAILFLVAAPPTLFRKKQDAITRSSTRGQTFHTVGLATLSIFAAASLSRHLGITAILVEVAAIFTVLIIQGQRLASTRAAQRFLVLMTLALPLFLLAAWRIDQYQLSAELQSDNYLQQTALLIGIGFALWLAVWPFHSWQSTIAAEASSPAAAFVLISFPIVAFSSLLNLLADSPWLITSSSLAWYMILAGGVTALLAGLLASVQRGFSPLMGYTAIFDLGFLLVILGVGGRTAIPTILVGLSIRALALTLISAGILAIRYHIADDGFAEITGLGRRFPVATVGVIIGGFILIGTPLTVGFPLRWQLLQAIESSSFWPQLLALAGLGVSIGYLRGLRALLSVKEEEQPNQADQSDEITLSIQEPRLLLIIIAILVIVCIVLGAFPSLVIEPIQTLSSEISIPIG